MSVAAAKPLPIIRPISDLRLRLNDVIEQAAQIEEPIILTKNGSPSIVLMDAETYNRQHEHERYFLALREAEIEEKYRPESIPIEDCDNRLREIFALWNIDFAGLRGIAYE